MPGRRAVNPRKVCNASLSQLFRRIFPRPKSPWGKRETWLWLHRIRAKDAATAGRYHARRGVVIPIGIIVAVAIVCVVVAVLGSAQRADEVAIATERQLFTRALHNHGERMLREVDAVANSDAAYRNIRLDFDTEWVQVYVGQRLQSYFDHHFVFVADPSDRFRTPRSATAASIRTGSTPSATISIPPSISCEGAATGAAGTHRWQRDPPAPRLPADQHASRRCRPSSAVLPSLSRSRSQTPTISRKTRGGQGAGRDEREAHRQRRAGGDRVTSAVAQPASGRRRAHCAGRLRLQADRSASQQVATFAWTPKRPGAEIVSSVIPFIAVAVAGFALLAALVLGHMRRTAATIASGESQAAPPCLA